jgi:hypothetical protein
VRRIVAGFVALFLLVGVSACSQDQPAAKQDIQEPEGDGKVLPEDFEARVPDVLTTYRNVDGHPTINKLCIEGIAWRTVSTAHSIGSTTGAAVRVPEWDDTCPDFDPNRKQFPTNGVGVAPTPTTESE